MSIILNVEKTEKFYTFAKFSQQSWRSRAWNIGKSSSKLVNKLLHYDTLTDRFIFEVPLSFRKTKRYKIRISVMQNHKFIFFHCVLLWHHHFLNIFLSKSLWNICEEHNWFVNLISLNYFWFDIQHTENILYYICESLNI